MPRSVTRTRRGFSLAELLIVVVVMGVVGGTIIKMIQRQQQFYRGTSDIVDARTQVRHATTVLATDLRSVSAAGTPSSPSGDITFASDTAMTLVVNTGSSIVCEKDGANNRVFYVPPRNLAKHQLTGWLSNPEVGDSVFIYDEGTSRGAEDDTWRGYQIAGMGTSTTKCVGAPYTDPTLDPPASKPRVEVTLASPLSTTTLRGAGVRFGRHVRYSLYQSANDRKWYLGYSEKRNGVWQATQPVSGPYLPYSATGGSGLSFRYYDSTGVQIANSAQPAGISRIDVRTRAVGQDSTTVSNGKRGIYVDSLTTRVSVRNRM
ncbi:MAG TPA: prepilin-type N-terminal cleavage/methylation domain-containing protein [Gemmatimonadaceae bacterium]|nr:prepilin-type N-terminal cleavage/methylation domain-containing protein [Gemmatimonadaceae bacterium]